jgi:hypothetical protein
VSRSEHYRRAEQLLCRAQHLDADEAWGLRNDALAYAVLALAAPDPAEGGSAGRRGLGEAVWEHAGNVVAWLDKHNGHGPEEAAARLLKVSEEVGETVQAYLGVTGQNPRKGITHAANDVLTELADVVISAVVAMHSFTDRDPAPLFAEHLALRAGRLAVLTDADTPPDTGCGHCGEAHLTDCTCPAF